MSENSPLVCELQPGTHFICACGKTQNAPYCDGSHKGCGISPVQKVVEDAPTRVAWCRCHQSGAKPYCDGSHSKL